MVACSDAAFAAWSDVIEVLSSRVFRLGERLGDGARVKLVNNLLAGINLAGAAEALALAERVGLGAARALDVIEQWLERLRLQRGDADGLIPAT